MSENYSLAFLLKYGGERPQLMSFCEACRRARFEIDVLALSMVVGEDVTMEELGRRSHCEPPAGCGARGRVQVMPDGPVSTGAADNWKGPTLA